MASSRKTPQESIYEQLNKRVKSLLSEEITNVSPFAKELYKKVRNTVKKLDDIRSIEEKIAAGFKGKLDEAQQEKMKNKDAYIQYVQMSLDTFDLYKKTEFPLR
jgi:DNA-directed RNA polymerase beta' subunit